MVGLTLSLSAGVVIVQEHGQIGDAAKMKSTLYVDGGKIRVESTMPDGKKTIMIFDGDKQVLWMIQPDQNSYMEMTAATVESISQMAGGAGAGAQMAQAQQKMQEAMANMTPEQRAMMEKAMAGRGGAMGGMPGGAPAAPRTITFQPKGGTDHVGRFTCTLYAELTNGQRSAEICAASSDQIQFKEADLRAFKALQKFMEPMAKMGNRSGFSAPSIEQLHGFPVHSVHYEGTRATTETTVLSADQKSVEANMFIVPAGMVKQDMMGGGRGGRRP
jgi:Domain of unknown function (DUF4412)